MGIIPNSRIANWYLFYSFLVLEKLLPAYVNSNTQDNLNATKVRSLQLIIPPLHEQHAIVAYLDRETARLDDLAAKVEAVIGALGEYRTALITATVTGQVDVRGAVEA